MMQLSPRTRLLVVGKPEMGKSSHVKALMRTWVAQGRRVVALDVCDEYSKQGDGRKLVELGGLKTRVTPQQLALDPSILLEPRLSLAVVSGEHPRDAARAFCLLSKILPHASKPVIYVCDEVGLWTDAARDPQCHRAAAELVSIAVGGRKHGIALAVVAQRATQVPQSVRTTVTDVHAFLQDSQPDIDALEDRCGKAFAEDVRRLGKFEHVAWSDGAHSNNKNERGTGT